jgi:putative chitinase
LREGAHGAAVTELQTQLNADGHPGTHGHALHVDGRFGPATRHAVENFQRDHGLVPDGIAGRQTLNALHASNLQPGKAQPSHAPTATQLNDPAHPDHALFTQAQGGVHRLDAEHGRAPDPRSDNLAASLAVAARNAGMSRVDHVALSTDAASVFAVQGALNSPFKQLTSVPTVEALNTPMTQSTQAWDRVVQQQTSQSQELQVSQAAQQSPREAVLPPAAHSM